MARPDRKPSCRPIWSRSRTPRYPTARRRDCRSVELTTVSVANELFSRRRIHDVGVNELIGCSAVAKSTSYRHFPSKDDLVRAVLARRDEVWFEEVVAETRRCSGSPKEELRAIFEVFADWLGSGGHKSNIFNALLAEVLVESGDCEVDFSVACGLDDDQGVAAPMNPA